jgi:puromycin-sensitive aminopeptidase
VIEPAAPFEWVLGNAGARGFYRTAYDGELLRRLISALPELRPEERMGLISDQWALVRAHQTPLPGFLQLLAGLKSEPDHVVLDEVVARLSYLEHRCVAEQDRPALHLWIQKLFTAAGADLGWDPRPGETDERRLLRSAVLRALAIVGRDPQAIRDALDRFPGRKHLDPNLLDTVVAVAARNGDAKRFEELKQAAATELDPAARRRYLHSLAMTEQPELVPQAVQLAMEDLVQMQDFSSYLSALLANRATREAAWTLVQSRWPEVRKKADSPMILRRLVESLGSLPERRHLAEVEKFLAAQELTPAKQAVAQTLERLRMDVALRERLIPEMAAFLRS